MKQATRFLRQFVAWATGLTDNLRSNPFTQAQAYIVLLQLLLTLILIGVIGWALQYQQQDTLGTISHHIDSSTTTLQISRDSLPEAIGSVHERTLEYVFLALIAATTLIGFLMARFALLPTKKSLQFQKRFIGNLAHELRTPLAIIKTNTEVGLMDPTIHSDVRETLDTTIEELDRISETINNLLSFDALIKPSQQKLEPINLAVCIDTVVERHQALARTRHIALHVQKSTPGFVMGNAIAFDQLTTNLVKNALNYTPADKDGAVTVQLYRDVRNRVVLSVADTGIGIDAKDLSHILEPFYRGDTSRARGIGTGSSGLGLAIVNEIARLYHGVITIKSTQGSGTTIFVTFPRAPESPSQKVT